MRIRYKEKQSKNETVEKEKEYRNWVGFFYSSAEFSNFRANTMALEARSLQQDKLLLIKNNTMKLLRLNSISSIFICCIFGESESVCQQQLHPIVCGKTLHLVGDIWIVQTIGCTIHFIGMRTQCIWIFAFYSWKKKLDEIHCQQTKIDFFIRFALVVRSTFEEFNI